MRVKILDAAETDLEDAYRFYERQSTGLGSYFLDSLYSDIDSLSYFGGIHRVVLGYHRLLSKREARPFPAAPCRPRRPGVKAVGDAVRSRELYTGRGAGAQGHSTGVG